MSAHPPVAVVVLAGRRPTPARAALESLSRQTLKPAEVLLADTRRDGALDGFRDGVLGFPVRVVPVDAPGYGEARNAALAAVESPWAAFLDDDCVAEPRWLERLAAALHDAEAVGGPTLPAERPLPGSPASPDWNAFAGLSGPGFWTDSSGRTELPQAANLALRIDLWRDFPFPATPEGESWTGQEDSAWWRTVRRAGRATAIERRAIVLHAIDDERYAKEAVLERARRDGAAAWRRDRTTTAIPAAAADVARVAIAALSDLFDPSIPNGEAFARHRPWAARQWAFLCAAADDYDAAFTPADRTVAIARESIRASVGWKKSIARRAATAVVGVAQRAIPDRRFEDAQRVLVVCHDYLGDAVLCEPLLAALKDQLRAEVAVLAGPANAAVFGAMPCVDEVVLPEAPKPDGGLRWSASVDRAVRRAEADAVLVAYAHRLPPLSLMRPGGPPAACWDRDQGFAQRLWGGLAHRVVPKSMRKHELAALADLAEPFGVSVPLRRPAIQPDEEHLRAAREHFRALGIRPADAVVVHVDGALGAWKTWPAESFRSLCEGLRDRLGAQVVAVGGDAGRRAFEEQRMAEAGARSLHGKLDPMVLGAAMRQAKLFIGPDSGPAHLAQAVGARTLVLFGPTDEERWGPLPRLAGERPLRIRTVRAASAPADWLPEEAAGFAPDEHMRRLSPERVLAAAADLAG